MSMIRRSLHCFLAVWLTLALFGCAGRGRATADSAPKPGASAPSPPGVAPSTAAATPPTGDARTAELNRIMAQLAELGTLDPQAQAQLMADLQKTDPSMWPLVVQAFRSSLAYRQKGKGPDASGSKPEGAGAAASVAGGAAPDDKTSQAAGATPAADKAAAPADAKATAVAASTANTPATAKGDDSPIKQVSHETPVDDKDQDWEPLLKKTIAALEKQVRDTPDSPEAARAQVKLRMLYLSAGRRDDALQTVTGVPHTEQEFWTDELYGLATYLDANRTSDNARRASDANRHLTTAANRLGELGSLGVRNLAFCTEVNSYGVYTPFEKTNFRPGQQVLLYAEIENFKSEQTPKGYHTAVQCSYRIVDSTGRHVSDHELPLTEEHCQNRRRDYFVRYFLTIPSRLYDGKYSLELTIEDTLARKIGQSSIDFTVKEK
jgi:hypothetical protein